MTFSATAYGTAPMQFQWQHAGTNVAGGTTNAYTINNVIGGSAGAYTLIISDYTGSVTSSVATLTVTGIPLPPSITSQPQNHVANLGSNATFTVSASGTAPLSYQWLLNGAGIAGAT